MKKIILMIIITLISMPMASASENYDFQQFIKNYESIQNYMALKAKANDINDDEDEENDPDGDENNPRPTKPCPKPIKPVDNDYSERMFKVEEEGTGGHCEP